MEEDELSDGGLDVVELVVGEVDVEQPREGIESPIKDSELVVREVQRGQRSDARATLLIRKLIKGIMVED